MNKNLKAQIFELLSQGYSKQEVAKKLGCTSSVICYHTSPGQKEKSNARGRKYRQSNPLAHKRDFFLKNKSGTGHGGNSQKTISEILNLKIHHFSYIKIENRVKRMFNLEQLIEKIGSEPKCYLTGRKIDLEQSRTYQLDHIIPRSKGGDNSLENCGLACKEANQAKNDLTLDEFYSLCEEIVKYKNSRE